MGQTRRSDAGKACLFVCLYGFIRTDGYHVTTGKAQIIIQRTCMWSDCLWVGPSGDVVENPAYACFNFILREVFQ